MILRVGDNDTTEVPKPSAKAVTSGMVIALHPIFAFDSQHAIDGGGSCRPKTIALDVNTVPQYHPKNLGSPASRHTVGGCNAPELFTRDINLYWVEKMGLGEMVKLVKIGALIC